MGCYTRGILHLSTEAVLRHDAEQGAAQRYEKMSAEARVLGAHFALDAYQTAQKQGHAQADRDVENVFHDERNVKV